MRLPLAERMTDRAFKRMLPLYVRGPHNSDHKCGGCNMRVELDGDRSYCTVVRGEVSRGRGVCNYWAPGKASKFEDIHEARMAKDSAGYVEFRGAINCESCTFHGKHTKFEPVEGVSELWCRLWMSEVGVGDCCISWEEKIRGRPMSEWWSHALDEGVGVSFTNRYDALGISPPDPSTMCQGPCEGTGYVPVCEDDTREPYRTRWLQAEAENPTDDGWHFVTCPTCDGTCLAEKHEAGVAKIAETREQDTPTVRAAKAQVSELLRRR